MPSTPGKRHAVGLAGVPLLEDGGHSLAPRGFGRSAGAQHDDGPVVGSGDGLDQSVLAAGECEAVAVPRLCSRIAHGDDGDIEATPVFVGCNDVDKRIYEGMGHNVNEDELDAVADLVAGLVGEGR